MFDTAVLRSGYLLKDSMGFSKRILDMLYTNLEIDPNTPVSKLCLYIDKLVVHMIKNSCLCNGVGWISTGQWSSGY